MRIIGTNLYDSKHGHFQRLNNTVSYNVKWLEVANLAINFVKYYGKDEYGNFYFALTASD